MEGSGSFPSAVLDAEPEESSWNQQRKNPHSYCGGVHSARSGAAVDGAAADGAVRDGISKIQGLGP